MIELTEDELKEIMADKDFDTAADDEAALTPYALRELVKAVYVEAPNKDGGKRTQRINISYDIVGFITGDELMKAEKV